MIRSATGAYLEQLCSSIQPKVHKSKAYSLIMDIKELEWLVLIDLINNDIPYLTECQGQIFYGLPNENKLMSRWTGLLA